MSLSMSLNKSTYFSGLHKASKQNGSHKR